MPTEQERPEMFARPSKTPFTLKRGPAYGAGAIVRATPRNPPVTDESSTIERQIKISQRPKAMPKSRIVGIAGSIDNLGMNVPLPQDPLNMPYHRAERHATGVHAVKHQHAEPLRIHSITALHNESRLTHHPDETNALSGSDASDTMESKVTTVQRADSLVEARSAKVMTSSAEPAGWKMINKGPVVLSPTPPPTVRDDELFLDTGIAASSPLVQATWSHVQSHSPKVSEVASLTESLSADMVDREEDSPTLQEASSETVRVPDLQPLTLNLADGPSLHEEIFGQPAYEKVKAHVSHERVADKLEEYTKYTGWIERE